MSEQVNGTSGAEKKQKQYGAEEFLLSAPMFVAVKVDEFNAPKRISAECPKCGKETTHEMVYQPYALGNREAGSQETPDYSLKSVSYKCMLCSGGLLTVVFREMSFGQKTMQPRIGTTLTRLPPQPPTTYRIVSSVMKVGQYPALSVAIPKGLAKALGEDAAGLYRKALICRNAGFGLAAVGYMRRVVEDKTNELIEVAALYADEFGADPNVVAGIRSSIDPSKYTPYEDKLKIAATVFPQDLKVGSINPLKVLFEDVSEGLHGLTEERCIEVADEIRTVFEYVFENLKAQVDDRRAFVEKVKKLS